MSDGHELDFEFMKSQSRIVCYGIDDEFSTESINNDITKITDAFRDLVSVHVSYIASNERTKCTVDGIPKSLQENLEEVHDNGLLIFYFTGHGSDDSAHPSTARAMIPAKSGTGDAGRLSARDLVAKLNIRPKTTLLFILDCCFSGGVTRDLSKYLSDHHDNTYLLSACTAKQQSHVSEALGCSVYTYFLSAAISKFSKSMQTTQDVTNFILTLIQVCTTACTEELTSLICDDDYQMTPTVAVAKDSLKKEPPPEDLTELITRFPLVRDIFEETSVRRLQRTTERFISDCKPFLRQLKDRDMLSKSEVVCAALSSMMYSIAIYEKSHLAPRNTQLNVFVAGLKRVINALDEHKVDHAHLEQGCYWGLKRYTRSLEKMKKKYNSEIECITFHDYQDKIKKWPQ